MLLVQRYWRAPHTLIMHHELPLLRQIANAVNARHHPVHVVKVPSHVGLHGNEVADSIAKWATSATAPGAEPDPRITLLRDTASEHPRGIGLQCPWDLISPATRKASGVGDALPAQGVPFDLFNSRPMLERLTCEHFEKKLLEPGENLPIGVARALGPQPLDPDNPHRPSRKLGAGIWSALPDSSLRTVVRVRSNDSFAGKKAFFSGATDSEFCTICESQLAGGGWEHTVSQCAHPVLRGLIINRHNEVVHLVRDAISEGRRGNSSFRITADLCENATRKRLFPNVPDPSVTADGEAQSPLPDLRDWDVSPDCPEWNGLPDDIADDSVLHDYGEPSPDPPMPAVEEGPDPLLQDRRLHHGAQGPVRIGPETFGVLPFRPPGPTAGGPGRQSATVPRDILDTTGASYIEHDTLDIVMVGSEDDSSARRVQLIDIAVCLEHRVATTIAAERAKYRPLREALKIRGYIVPPLEVVVVCARSAIPMSTIETMRRLGVDPKPTDTLLRKAHVITTTYLRRLCHSQRAVEATTMGTHGICTRLIAAKKTLRRAAYSSRKRPDTRRG
jgi:hypothetical protein